MRHHAAHVRDSLDQALNSHLDASSVPVTGLLHGAGHAAELHAARFAQQMNQLTLVLDSYQATAQRTGT
ncbi:hypothetical protein [Streptomyces sp. 35G-GA-8]|uniref:hypothetical protein n=1 Tax=Streptomyces sp. 35G-GA-8 TaxID=2939434 RepID=UPI00201ED497|nr:hypothetical protein [Streptomyces sp. 35G-GA-8]MCL7377033.1 hypothetical protein [Streptomyces sp. 35G-GA-8]